MQPAVAAGPGWSASARGVHTFPAAPGSTGVPRLARQGQDAGDSRGVLAGAQAGQRRSPRNYFTSARQEATEWAPGRGTARPTGAQLPASRGRSSLPRSLPTALRTRASRPRPASSRPFRQRRRGESGPGGAQGSGGSGAATPAGRPSSADRAENRPGRSGAQKAEPRVCFHVAEESLS